MSTTTKGLLLTIPYEYLRKHKNNIGLGNESGRGGGCLGLQGQLVAQSYLNRKHVLFREHESGQICVYMILKRNMSTAEIAYSSFFPGEMKKEASLSEADFQKEKVSISLTQPLFLRLTFRRRRGAGRGLS